MKFYKFLVFLQIFLCSLLTIMVAYPKFVQATVTQDNALGYYEDDFSDNSGMWIDSLNNIGVNTSSKALELTPLAAPPYNTFGTAISDSIIAGTHVHYNDFSWHADVPTGTTLKIQIACDDGTPISDKFLPGNMAGFSTSPIDLSSFNFDATSIEGYQTHSVGKIARYSIKVTMTTTDQSKTPSLKDWKLTWELPTNTNNLGNIASSTWPKRLGKNNSNHIEKIGPEYPVIVKSKSLDTKVVMNSLIANDSSGNLYVKTDGDGWYDFEYGKFIKMDESDFSNLYEYNLPGNSYNHGDMVVTDTGGVIFTDFYHDFMGSLDSSGNTNWIYPFAGGHNDFPYLLDGKIYISKPALSNGNLQLRGLDSNAASLTGFPVDTGIFYDSLGANNIVSDGSNLYYYCGYGSNYYLISVDQSGNERWRSASHPRIFQITMTEDNHLLALTLEPDGYIYIYAYDTNQNELWHIKTSTSGSGYLYYYTFMSYDRINKTVSFSTMQSKASLTDRMYAYGVYSTVDCSKITESMENDSGTGIYLGNMLGTLNNDYIILKKYDIGEGLNMSTKLNIRDKSTGNLISSYVNGENESFANVAHYGHLDSIMISNAGNMYALADRVSDDAYIVKIKNLDLNVFTDKSKYQPGDIVNFTVETPLPQTEFFSGHSNQMQLIINDQILAMTYRSTLGENSYWVGCYQIPADQADGFLSFDIEAQQYNLMTNQTVHFANNLYNTNNTGVKASSQIKIDHNAEIISLNIEELPATGADLSITHIWWHNFLELFAIV